MLELRHKERGYMSIKKGDFEKLSADERKAYIDMFTNSTIKKKPLYTSGWPDNNWHIIPGLLGFPVERHSRLIKHPLIISSFIILFIGIYYFAANADLHQFIRSYGFIYLETHIIFIYLAMTLKMTSILENS